jgi:hypothetical protein
MIRFGIEKTGRRQRSVTNYTPMAVALAAAIGITALQCAEIVYDNGRDERVPHNPGAAMWRVHMGCTCAGCVAFAIALFCLERLGRGSMLLALRSTIPWLPTIALTGLATAIHIPMYVVIPLIILYGLWAYRRTLAVR